MKIHEILEQARLGDWFRPVRMAGAGSAYTIHNDLLCSVPSKRGATPSYVYADELKGEWEFVTPDAVLLECEKWSQ